MYFKLKGGGNVEIEGLQTVPAAAFGLLAVLAEAIGSECLSITYNINPKYTSHKLMKLKVCPSRALGSLYRGGIHYPFNNEVCIRPTVHRTNTRDVRVSPKYRRTDVLYTIQIKSNQIFIARRLEFIQ